MFPHGFCFFCPWFIVSNGVRVGFDEVYHGVLMSFSQVFILVSSGFGMFFERVLFLVDQKFLFYGFLIVYLFIVTIGCVEQ